MLTNSFTVIWFLLASSLLRQRLLANFHCRTKKNSLMEHKIVPIFIAFILRLFLIYLILCCDQFCYLHFKCLFFTYSHLITAVINYAVYTLRVYVPLITHLIICHLHFTYFTDHQDSRLQWAWLSKLGTYKIRNFENLTFPVLWRTPTKFT